MPSQTDQSGRSSPARDMLASLRARVTSIRAANSGESPLSSTASSFVDVTGGGGGGGLGGMGASARALLSTFGGTDGGMAGGGMGRVARFGRKA